MHNDLTTSNALALLGIFLVLAAFWYAAWRVARSTDAQPYYDDGYKDGTWARRPNAPHGHARDVAAYLDGYRAGLAYRTRLTRKAS